MFKLVVEILEGWEGGYFSGQKMEILGRRGDLREISSMVGVRIPVFSGTTQCLKILCHPSPLYM